MWKHGTLLALCAGLALIGFAEVADGKSLGVHNGDEHVERFRRQAATVAPVAETIAPDVETTMAVVDTGVTTIAEVGVTTMVPVITGMDVVTQANGETTVTQIPVVTHVPVFTKVPVVEDVTGVTAGPIVTDGPNDPDAIENSKLTAEEEEAFEKDHAVYLFYRFLKGTDGCSAKAAAMLNDKYPDPKPLAAAHKCVMSHIKAYKAKSKALENEKGGKTTLAPDEPLTLPA